MQDIQPYLDSKDRIDYSSFATNYVENDDVVFSNISKFISEKVKDILLIDIQEDKLFLSEKEKNKLPPTIKNLLNYSECRGVKMYVFQLKDWSYKVAFGVFGGSTWRTNEYYFSKLFEDPQYQDIASKTTINLTQLFNS